MIGDLPDFDHTVLAARGDDIVIVGAPGDVQHGALVPANQGVVGIDPANLKVVIIKKFIYSFDISIIGRVSHTLARGSTMKAPPPADSTMMARNLGLTAQKVESHEDLETLTLS